MIIKLISTHQKESFLWDKLHRAEDYSDIQYIHKQTNGSSHTHRETIIKPYSMSVRLRKQTLLNSGSNLDGSAGMT